MAKTGRCVDCGKQTKGYGERCHSCAAKMTHTRGDFDNPEYRRKISEVMKKAWTRGVYDEICTPEYRHKKSTAIKIAWAKGAYDEICTPEYRRKISEGIKAVHARGVYDNPEYRRKMSDATKARWICGGFDDVFRPPYKTTEVPLAAALDICSIEHISQYRPDGYSRIYDEFVPPNLLIEIHGDYWHGPERPKVQKRDVEKAVWAKDNGYHLVIIWEHEIKEQGAWSLVHKRILPLLPIAVEI